MSLDPRLALETARQVGVGVGIYRADGRFVWVNEAYASMLDYDQQELIDRPIWTVNPDFREGSMEAFWDSVPEGDTRFYEGNHRRADGSEFPVEMVVTRITHEGTGYHVGTVRDITARRRAREALRESQERFEQLASNTDQQFWLVDADYEEVVFLNRAARDFWQDHFENADNLLKALEEAVHPEDRERLLDAAQRVRSERVELEYRVRRPGGDYRWFQISGFPIRTDAGSLYRVGGIASDITERKRIQEALRESEQRFRELAENSELQFWMSDPDFEGTIFLNEVDRDFWSDFFEGQDNIADALARRIHPEDLDRFLEGVGRVREEPAESEVRIRTPDDDYKWFHVTGFPIHNEQGEVYRLGGVVRDVDERKQQERELERANYILNATPDGVYHVNADREITMVNDAAADMTGYDRDQLVGEPITQLLPDDQLEKVEEEIEGIKQKTGPKTGTFEIMIRREDGETIPCENHLAILPPYENSGSVGILRDIRERKERQRDLERSRWMLNTVGDVVYALDRQGRLVDINVTEDGIFGYTQEEVQSVVGRPVEDWLREEDVERARDLILELQGSDRRQARFEMELVAADGSRVVCENNMTVARSGGDANFQGTVGVLRDVTERKKLEEQMRRRALYDDLTGLPNRSLFMDRLEERIQTFQSGDDGLFAVVYMDLDRFKIINESMGHHVGDKLLEAVAQRLEDRVGPRDTVARLGGDDFALLLDVSNPDEALEDADRITRALERPFELEDQKIFSSASTGVVVPSSREDIEPESLLRDADIAMFRSKSERKPYVLFDPDMHRETRREMELEMDLKRSTQRDELELHYQPIVRLDPPDVLGFEALVRWNHPDRGRLPPGEFLPLAKKIGYMSTIDDWALDRACRDLRGWRQSSGPTGDLFISVNISPLQLADPDFVDRVTDVLEASGLNPDTLYLEITENAVVANPEQAAEVIGSLQNHGVHVVMDDFGTGYSSLSYLSSLPIDGLKIDRSFIHDLEDGARNGASRRIVQAIMNLADGLETPVIAEGIETEAHTRSLRSMDCTLGQGYYYAEPMAASEVLDFIERFPDDAASS